MLAAELTPANVVDNEQAPTLLPELPAEGASSWATSYNDPDLHQPCALADRVLIAPQRGKDPHHDDVVEVRRVFHIFHELRSRAIENLDGQFKGIFDCLGKVPTRGLCHTQPFILSAVFVYQLSLWYR